MLRYGTDSSGRPIYATPFATAWLDALVASCQDAKRLSGGRVENFTPVVVQGAFMAQVAGGGAKASAGYHDGAGTYDFRTWNLSREQLGFLVRECRRMAGAAWPRDKAHGGMDPHCHVTIGPDTPEAQSPGARAQWADYLNDRNGLTGSSAGPDYCWRPDPLVTSWTPPAPAPAKTPNVTAALTAKTLAGRKAALRRVIAHGSPAARKWGQAWLTSLLAVEAATKKANAAQKALRGVEVR